ncbi:MAG: hypothetical protein IT374_01010 [Polyangiaceae bacterium]|nr:hypothetical protein [Polyangiaceae bacterium]
MSPRARALLAAVPLLLAACGAAPRPAGAPQKEPPLSTVEEAEAELSRAEASLPEGADGEEKARPVGERPKDAAAPPATPMGGVAQPATTPSPPPAPAKTTSDRARDDEEAPRAEAAEPPPTPCQTACRALASMRRAADAVCRLAGATDARCDSAQRRVDAATARVAHCGCRQ